MSERANAAENAGAGTTFGRTAGDGIRLPLLISSSLHSHANRVAEHSQKEVKDDEKSRVKRTLQDDVSGLSGHRNRCSASEDAGHQQTLGIRPYQRRIYLRHQNRERL